MKPCRHYTGIPEGLQNSPDVIGNFNVINDFLCLCDTDDFGCINAIKGLLSLREKAKIGYKAFALYLGVSAKIHEFKLGLEDIPSYEGEKPSIYEDKVDLGKPRPPKIPVVGIQNSAFKAEPQTKSDDQYSGDNDKIIDSLLVSLGKLDCGSGEDLFVPGFDPKTKKWTLIPLPKGVSL
jgi:hypothetical protein